MGKKKSAYRIFVEKRRKEHFEYLAIDGGIILNGS
jgi:hypothetical protein